MKVKFQTLTRNKNSLLPLVVQRFTSPSWVLSDSGDVYHNAFLLCELEKASAEVPARLLRTDGATEVSSPAIGPHWIRGFSATTVQELVVGTVLCTTRSVY